MGIGLLAAILLGACGGSATPGDTGAPRHVFEIVMENHSASETLSGPFTASLAARYGLASNYRAVSHPSVPNYLALTSGSTWGITDDSYHALPKQDLGSQLTTAGVTWRAYMEGLGDGGCLNSPLPYDPGHNPFAFYGGGCPANVVAFTALSGDLAGSTPRFVWITPDMCHDTHNCSIATGDDWLKQTVGEITASAAWNSRGVLFITWDEDDGSSTNQVLTLVIAQGVAHRESLKPYDHYSLLATIEDLLGVGRLGAAARAQPMSDLLG
ncbi:MAG TPA: alkaline phosphatase family protein [Candidatus Dormibacteraeota bacterium]